MPLSVPAFCWLEIKNLGGSCFCNCVDLGFCWFGLVFTQPHIFLEVDECQNSLFEAIRKYRLHRK